jgi:gamma-butyrobetaine dioxygenase
LSASCSYCGDNPTVGFDTRILIHVLLVSLPSALPLESMFLRQTILRLPGRRYLGSVQIFSGAVKIPNIDTPLPLPWLRDSCQCSSCVHPSTKQKLRESSSVSPQVQPASEPGSVSLTDSGLKIQWDSRFDPEHQSHTSTYPLDFLSRYSSSRNLRKFHLDLDVVKWTAADVKQSPDLYVTYRSIQGPAGLLKAITQLVQYGLIFVTDVPPEKTDNAHCELQNLAQVFGEIRETFYGRVWDVKNVTNSKNIAYTNLNLDLHMDLLSVWMNKCANLILTNHEQVPTESSPVPIFALSPKSRERGNLHFRGCL